MPPLAKPALAFAAALVVAPMSSGANAAPIVFATPPFAGSTADPNDGVRTVFGGNERFLPSFDFARDVFVLDPAAFGVSGPSSFASGNAASLPGTGADVVVLLDTDNDANAATPFNAGTAANLIANAITESGPGFFVYWNSVLGVNRLVYSTDLGAPTGDLAILARITSPSGAAAAAALPGFGASNFAVASVPEPGALGLTLGALALAGATLRRRRPPAARPAEAFAGDLREATGPTAH